MHYDDDPWIWRHLSVSWERGRWRNRLMAILAGPIALFVWATGGLLMGLMAGLLMIMPWLVQRLIERAENRSQRRRRRLRRPQMAELADISLRTGKPREPESKP